MHIDYSLYRLPQQTRISTGLSEVDHSLSVLSITQAQQLERHTLPDSGEHLKREDWCQEKFQAIYGAGDSLNSEGIEEAISSPKIS